MDSAIVSNKLYEIPRILLGISFCIGGLIIQTLNEDNRQKLIAKSKSSEKGRERFNKRNKSKVANTVKSFNQINMNKLFKQDILSINIPVHGETDDYTVNITFGGFLEILRDQVERTNDLTYREISRAAIIGFNRDDVFISCTCPDQVYRFQYWSTRNNTNSGAPETRPSDITNPDDKLGSSCKHILLVLNNTSWVLRVARVISNYIDYMKKHYQKMYADVIYPAIYSKEYEEPVQLPIEDEIADDVIDKANLEKQKLTQFQKGNTQGVRFAKEPKDALQQKLDVENPDDEL